MNNETNAYFASNKGDCMDIGWRLSEDGPRIIDRNRTLISTSENDVERALKMFELVIRAGQMITAIADDAENGTESEAEAVDTVGNKVEDFIRYIIQTWRFPEMLASDFEQFAKWCGAPVPPMPDSFRER